MKKTVSAGGIVLLGDSVLLVSNFKGKGKSSWTFPKGHIEEGEDELGAAKREIYEESGVSELKFIRRLGEYERYRIGFDGKDDREELKKIVMFLFTTTQKTLKPIDSSNPEAEWIKKDRVKDFLTSSKDREFYLNSGI